MKAIILNSGIGKRLGEYTAHNPKCMVSLGGEETILLNQLRQLKEHGITDIIISTGYMAETLQAYASAHAMGMAIRYVYNPDYLTSNYITSLDLVEDVDTDTLLLHGDLVFSGEALEQVLSCGPNAVAVDTLAPPPEKDFKALVEDGFVRKIGTYLSGQNCLASQPLYFLDAGSWKMWKKKIKEFCDRGMTDLYAEEALNEVIEDMAFRPADVCGKLCNEIDTVEDLERIRRILNYGRTEE